MLALFLLFSALSVQLKTFNMGVVVFLFYYFGQTSCFNRTDIWAGTEASGAGFSCLRVCTPE